jgi:hypothetical protein
MQYARLAIQKLKNMNNLSDSLVFETEFKFTLILQKRIVFVLFHWNKKHTFMLSIFVLIQLHMLVYF